MFAQSKTILMSDQYLIFSQKSAKCQDKVSILWCLRPVYYIFDATLWD